MRDRLVTLVGALGALAIVYVLFGQQPAEPPITRPLSTEAGPNGYLGLRTWLERHDVATLSWQERFDGLLAPNSADDPDLADSGNILITTVPHLMPLRINEDASLHTWIRRGNTLLLLVGLDDTPSWSSTFDAGGFMSNLERLTGLRFTPYVGEDRRPESPPLRVPRASPIELVPATAHPLMEGIETLRGFSDQPSGLWSAQNDYPDRLVLRLAVERSTGIDALWQLPRGDGQIIMAASGTLLTNANIAKGDARTFVANLLRYHLARGGTVIFDDMHQGLTNLYDAGAFFRDSRLYSTVLFAIVGWLVYLLGSSNRLAPPVQPTVQPRQSDFLAAAGGFMARRLDQRAAGLLLLEEWFAEVRAARGLARSDAPPWTELEATPALAKRTYAELRRCYERLTSGAPVDLIRLHNLLGKAREAIG